MFNVVTICYKASILIGKQEDEDEIHIFWNIFTIRDALGGGGQTPRGFFLDHQNHLEGIFEANFLS